jgi:hypothetical protein
MGLQSTRQSGIVRKDDAAIAKNHLTEPELQILHRIVNLYIEYAELQALERKPMTMQDWITKLDEFLKVSGRVVLDHAVDLRGGRQAEGRAGVRALPRAARRPAPRDRRRVREGGQAAQEARCAEGQEGEAVVTRQAATKKPAPATCRTRPGTVPRYRTIARYSTLNGRLPPSKHAALPSGIRCVAGRRAIGLVVAPAPGAVAGYDLPHLREDSASRDQFATEAGRRVSAQGERGAPDVDPQATRSPDGPLASHLTPGISHLTSRGRVRLSCLVGD